MDLAQFKKWLANCYVTITQVQGLREWMESVVLASGWVPNTRKVNNHALSADVTVTKSDVGLGNCDNTSDANKPISSATATALSGKQATLGFTPEDVANKSTDGTMADNSPTKYPSQSAVVTYVAAHAGGGGTLPGVEIDCGSFASDMADIDCGAFA